MKLKKGDVIDIIAPSSAPKNKDWLKGIKILKKWGLKPRYNSSMLSPWLFHANKNNKRLELLKKSLSNSQSKAIWPVRGGYGLQKIMPNIVKSKIHKKLYIGFSDSTAMHIYLNGVKKIPSLHAPFVSELSSLSSAELKNLKSILFKETKEITFSNLNLIGKKPKNKKIKAKIVGGNLTILSTSLACAWFPKTLGSCFLFLEDVDEEAYKIDRYLHQLFFSGAMKNVKAILIGSFSPLKKSEINKVLKSFSEISKIPVFTSLPCGHVAKNKALPFLKAAEISITKSGKAKLIVKL